MEYQIWKHTSNGSSCAAKEGLLLNYYTMKLVNYS